MSSEIEAALRRLEGVKQAELEKQLGGLIGRLPPGIYPGTGGKTGGLFGEAESSSDSDEEESETGAFVFAKPQTHSAVADAIAGQYEASAQTHQTLVQTTKAEQEAALRGFAITNETKYESESEWAKVFDLTLMSKSDKESFFKSEHFQAHYLPILKVYGQTIKYVTVMPRAELRAHAEVRAVFALQHDAKVFPDLWSQSRLADGTSVFQIPEAYSRQLDAQSGTLLQLFQTNVNGGQNFKQSHAHVGIYRTRFSRTATTETYFLIVCAGLPAESIEFVRNMIHSQGGNPLQAVRMSSDRKTFAVDGSECTMAEFADCIALARLQRKGTEYRVALTRAITKALGIEKITLVQDIRHHSLFRDTNVDGEARIRYYSGCQNGSLLRNGTVLPLAPLQGYELFFGKPFEHAAVQKQYAFGGQILNEHQYALPLASGRTMYAEGKAAAAGRTDQLSEVQLAALSRVQWFQRKSGESKKILPERLIPGSYKDLDFVSNVMVEKLGAIYGSVFLTPVAVQVAAPSFKTVSDVTTTTTTVVAMAGGGGKDRRRHHRHHSRDYDDGYCSSEDEAGWMHSSSEDED